MLCLKTNFTYAFVILSQVRARKLAAGGRGGGGGGGGSGVVMLSKTKKHI